MFKVKFVVKCKPTKNQQAIKIVGNLFSLGNWNPMNGLSMQEYYDGQWQSIKQIQIQKGQQFQFKIIKISHNTNVQWEQLPNNANRKFKPKFHTKLLLTWNNNIGQALNQGKSSLKLKGLPGVMVKGNTEAGILTRNPIKKKNINKNILHDSSQSQCEQQTDSFCNVINRKKSSDIRQSINSGDIDQIYYETTEFENAYHNYKKIQINLVCNNFEDHPQFIQKIQQEVKELFQLQNIFFKWILIDDHSDGIRSRRLNVKRIEHYHQGKIDLQYYIHKNVHKNHFIFLDLSSALKTQIGNNLACLYLPSTQLPKVSILLNQLQKFQFICFDHGQTNKQFYKLIELKKKQRQICQQKSFNHHLQTIQIEKHFENITLQKIVQQLECCTVSQTSVNTVHTFSKNQALMNILVPNSVLILDSEIMKTDKKLFLNFTDPEIQKRLIIIVHKGGMAQWMTNYSQSKNICVIYQNFTKLYFFGKLYDPSRKHRNIIDFIKMRAKLCQQQIGGSWTMNDHLFSYKIPQGTQLKFQSIKNQIQNALKKDFNYFKMTMKQYKIKISWNFSHQVRLLRTLIKIKSIQQGQIGNFYFVSQKQNFSQIKQQIKLLINVNYYWMIHGKHTKIYDFGYGQQSIGKYSIIIDEVGKQSFRS